jgi:hypothetical protein
MVGMKKPYKELGKEIASFYDHDERLDGADAIANYLGISPSYFWKKLRWAMDESGIIFYRPKSMKTKKRGIFTYKRLVLSWLMKRKQL